MRVLTAFYGDAFASSVADLTIAQLDDDARLARLSAVTAADIAGLRRLEPELIAFLRDAPSPAAGP